jgi:hypothetical protein
VRLAPKKKEKPLHLEKGSEVEVYLADPDHCWEKAIVKARNEYFCNIILHKSKIQYNK